MRCNRAPLVLKFFTLRVKSPQRTIWEPQLVSATGVATQRAHVAGKQILVGIAVRVSVDQRPKRSIGVAPVIADLSCEGGALSCQLWSGTCCAAASAASAWPRWTSMIVSVW